MFYVQVSYEQKLILVFHKLIAFMNKKKSDATFPSFDVATGFTEFVIIF